jgi:hypothetical protein
MSDFELDSKWEAFKNKFKNVSPDEIDKYNKLQSEQVEEQFKEFRKYFSLGECSICGERFSSFKPDKPCPHWLLRPVGVKKGHIADMMALVGYFRVAAYIRWISNIDTQFVGINDLSDEGRTDAIFHWTARYKHITWTVICTRADYDGHQGRRSSLPHYHFKMQLDGNIFIRFDEFHILFTDEDLFNWRCNLDPDSPIKQSFGIAGAGMNALFSMDPEAIIQTTKTTTDEKEAQYHLTTMISDPAGISGDLINEALKKSQESGRPIANILREMGLQPSVIIEPPENIPDKQIRPHPRKKTQ